MSRLSKVCRRSRRPDSASRDRRSRQRGGGAPRRPAPGRSARCGGAASARARGGRSIAVAGSDARPLRVLLRRDRRRPLEDDRRRHHLDAGHRRPDQPLVGRRGRRLGVESRHRLHRHGRDGHPRQHHPGRRRLQVDRRRQDLDAHRPRRHAGDLARSASIPTNPDIVYVAAFGHHARAERRARRLPLEGRRQDLGEDPLPRRQDRRDRPDASIRTTRNVLYAALWEAYRNAYEMSSGGPGSGLFKSTDGGDHWTEISRNPGLPKGDARQDRRRRCRAPTRTASTRRSKPRTAASSCPTTPARRGSRSTSDRNLRQRAFYYTRIYADPKDKDTVYVLNVRLLRSRPTAARRWKMRQRAARRQPRPVDRIRRTRSG